MIAAGGGSIVTIASVLGVVGGGVYPNVSYQAAKGGVINTHACARAGVGAYGIRVNSDRSDLRRTRFVAGLLADPGYSRQLERRTPTRPAGRARGGRRAVLFLAGRGSAMVTGHVLAVDGGYLAQ